MGVGVYFCEIMNNSYFDEYLNGKIPTLNRATYFIWIASDYFNRFILSIVIYSLIPYKYVGSKLIIFTYCIFTLKDFLSSILFIPDYYNFIDWIFVSLLFLFIFKGYYKYKLNIVNSNLNNNIVYVLIKDPKDNISLISMFLRLSYGSCTYVLNNKCYGFKKKSNKLISFNYAPEHNHKLVKTIVDPELFIKDFNLKEGRRYNLLFFNCMNWSRFKVKKYVSPYKK